MYSISALIYQMLYNYLNFYTRVISLLDCKLRTRFYMMNGVMAEDLLCIISICSGMFSNLEVLGRGKLSGLNFICRMTTLLRSLHAHLGFELELTIIFMLLNFYYDYCDYFIFLHDFFIWHS